MSDQQYKVGYAIARTGYYQRTLLHKLFAKHTISITNEQWVVLKTIASQTGITQTEISKRTLKDKTNITRILDLLEKGGYIRRNKDESDRRIYRITLSSKGASVLESVTPLVDEGELIVCNALTELEQQQLIALLSKVSLSIKEVL